MNNSIMKCLCGSLPEMHSRWIDDEEIYDGIVCELCDIAVYGDPLCGGEESETVINEWNDKIIGMSSYE